jgi:hypothetical protein
MDVLHAATVRFPRDYLQQISSRSLMIREPQEDQVTVT